MAIEMISRKPNQGGGRYDDIFSSSKAAEVLSFHKTLKDYRETPLRRLSGLSDLLGVRDIFVKDESYRFGLNAFKGLGGSYALASVIAKVTDRSIADIGDIPEGSFTFVTATDGNHGRGIAWAAKNLGQKAIVYMPKGSSAERLDNIRAQGTEAEIIELNYDDTVRFASEQAEKNGWILIQDTAWEGYEDIPKLIMQGYMTMGAEIAEQIGDIKPTHIFLQAGVGAMAGAMSGFFSDIFGPEVKIIIVEPKNADCVFRTAKMDDERLHKVEGDLSSIMAGLCCGEVCTIGWEELRHHAGYFFSVPDYVSADGMRVLGNPVRKDERIISGESGAVTAGLLYELMTKEELGAYKEELSLSEDSVVLCISTEGDTDRDNYRHIVWDGWYRDPGTLR